MTGHELMPIGEFARRCRLPVSTLRYYHQQGLFTPAHVDPATGYRYYERCQLEMATTVSELRALGMTPAMIGRVTSGDLPLDVALRAERERLQAESDERARAIAGVDALLRRVAAGAVTVTTRLRPAQRVAVTHGEMASETAKRDVTRLIARLRSRLRAEGNRGEAHFGALFPLDLETDPVPVTVFAPVDGLDGAGSTLVLPATTVAVAEHRGDYALTSTYDALLGWMSGAGFEPDGPVIEEYVGGRRSPHTRVSIGIRS